MTTSLDAKRLAPDGKLDSSAIDATTADEAAVVNALQAATEPAHQAALAIVCGLRGHAKAQPQLVALLNDDGLAGRAASWALAKLGGEDVVQAALSVVETGGVVGRENAYQTLCSFVAMHGARPELAGAMVERVKVENERAKSGRTGLGDQALRVLAALGDDRVEELAKQIIDADRFASRVEIDRLRRAMKEDGKDAAMNAKRRGAWKALFADAIVPIVDEKEKAKSPPSPSAAPAQASKPPAAGEPPAVGPVDWAAFVESPEAKSLPVRAQGAAKQFGSLLEQISERAVGVPLGELSGQELIAILLQIIPQSLPQPSVQQALSPEALLAYEAVARFLTRTGNATSGAELVAAVRQVRKQLREQVRQSGLLDGPDYSDPPEPVAT